MFSKLDTQPAPQEGQGRGFNAMVAPKRMSLRENVLIRRPMAGTQIDKVKGCASGNLVSSACQTLLAGKVERHLRAKSAPINH